jgi:hypothetical protein
MSHRLDLTVDKRLSLTWIYACIPHIVVRVSATV